MNPEVWLLPSRSVEVVVPQPEGDPIIMRTLVEKGVLYREFRIIAPMRQGKVFMFDNIDKISIIFSVKEGKKNLVYELDCRIISKLRVEDIPVVSLSIIGEAHEVQRRQAFRVNISNNIRFSYNGCEHELITKDISLTGILAVTDANISVRDKINIFWDSVGSDSSSESFLEDDSFTITATLLSKTYIPRSAKYEIRLSFDHLPEPLSRKLLKYLYKKQSEQIRRGPEFSDKFEEFLSDEDYRPQVHRIGVFTLISLSLLLIGVVLFFLARPEDRYGIDKFFDLYRKINWNPFQLTLSVITIGIAAFIEMIGLVEKISMKIQGRYNLKISTFIIFIIELIALGIVVSVAVKNGIPLSINNIINP